MYSKEQKDVFKEIIIEEISIGKSLKSILDKHKAMPDRPTVYTWLNSESKQYDKDFLNNYIRARQDQADFYADEIIDISDTEEDPNKARVRIDARKWKAGKMKPSVYSEKLDITTKGEKVNDIKLSADQIDKILEKL